jgi:ATP-dependent DNA ligase
MLEALCRQSSTTLDIVHAEDGPPITQRTSGLVLAVRDKAKKRWVYAGHVGTGFDQASLKSIHETMQPLRTNKKQIDQK